MTSEDYSEFLPSQILPLGFNSRFRAYNNVVQALPVVPAWLTVQFPTENFDGLGEYNAANGIFTANANGYYLLITNLGSNLNGGDGFHVVLWLAGFGAFASMDFYNGPAHPQRQHSGVIAMIYYLVAGSQVTVRANTDVAAWLNGGTAGCTFAAHRLS